MVKIAAQILAKKKISPPKWPRFSKTVKSAKYERHEGIPKPNEEPNKNETIVNISIDLSINIKGANEKTIPETIQIKSTLRLVVVKEKKTPQKLENTMVK